MDSSEQRSRQSRSLYSALLGRGGEVCKSFCVQSYCCCILQHCCSAVTIIWFANTQLDQQKSCSTSSAGLSLPCLPKALAVGALAVVADSRSWVWIQGYSTSSARLLGHSVSKHSAVSRGQRGGNCCETKLVGSTAAIPAAAAPCCTSKTLLYSSALWCGLGSLLDPTFKQDILHCFARHISLLGLVSHHIHWPPLHENLLRYKNAN